MNSISWHTYRRFDVTLAKTVEPQVPRIRLLVAASTAVDLADEIFEGFDEAPGAGPW